MAPRLDDSDYVEMANAEDLGVDIAKYERDGTPIDVCYGCYYKNGFTSDVDHPPYADGHVSDGKPMHCAVCGDELKPIDDWGV